MAGDIVAAIKTAVKEMLLRIGGERLVLHYWSWQGKDVGYMAAGARGERFQRIYRDGVWTKDDRDAPLSGLGSSLDATGQLRTALPALLKELGVERLVDVGCGDFTWMAHTATTLTSYVGVDIVPEVVAANARHHASPTRSFMVMDVCETVPPLADAILCREVLFHLSFKDAEAAIGNMRRSGARYLITSSDPNVRVNGDIPTGDFRDINLASAPYNLGEPLRTISEASGPNPNRILGVWRLDAG